MLTALNGGTCRLLGVACCCEVILTVDWATEDVSLNAVQDVPTLKQVIYVFWYLNLPDREVTLSAAVLHWQIISQGGIARIMTENQAQCIPQNLVLFFPLNVLVTGVKMARAHMQRSRVLFDVEALGMWLTDYCIKAHTVNAVGHGVEELRCTCCTLMEVCT